MSETIADSAREMSEEMSLLVASLEFHDKLADIQMATVKPGERVNPTTPAWVAGRRNREWQLQLLEVVQARGERPPESAAYGLRGLALFVQGRNEAIAARKAAEEQSRDPDA